MCVGWCTIPVSIKYPAHLPPPEEGSTGLDRWCCGALQGVQVQTSLCRRATSGLALGPTQPLRPVGPLVSAPTRNATQPAYPLLQLLPPVPLPFSLRLQHHCTTQPNATLARADLLNRLHLLAFIHLPLFSNHNHSSPRHLRSCLVLTVSQFPKPIKSPSLLSTLLQTFQTRPPLGQPTAYLDIHSHPARMPILTKAAGPELIRTRS